MKYAYNPAGNSVKVYGRSLNVSGKSSAILCRKISGMGLRKGKAFLEGMVSQKRSMDGKFYTTASREMLGLLKSGESNAESKGLDTERLVIHASAHQGFTFMRPRRLKMRGTRKKITNVQLVLVER